MKTKQFILIAFLTVYLSTIYASPFTPGNLVVTRVGAGSVITTGDKVFLDEYTPAGLFVQTIALPVDFYGPQSIEACLTSLSGDGQFLTLSGLTTASPVLPSVDALTAPRSIASVKYDGTISILTPTLRLPAATATATMVVNSPIITIVSGGADIAVGQYVYGIGIPLGAKVASVDGPTQITLTINTPSATGNVSLHFMTEQTPFYSNCQVPKGVYTTNGNDFWLGSGDSYIQYFNPTVNDGVPVNIAAVDARYITAVNGVLWRSVKYGTRIASIGTSSNPFPKTPETTLVTAMPLKNIGDSIAQDPSQIITVDLNPNEPGDDVMYAAEFAFRGKLRGIKKYVKVNEIWQYKGGYGVLTQNFTGVTAKVSNATTGEVTLYAIRKVAWITAGTSGNYRYRGGELVKLIDVSGYQDTMRVVKDTVLQAHNVPAVGVPAAGLSGMWRSVSYVPKAKAPNALISPNQQTTFIYPTMVTDELNLNFTNQSAKTINIVSLDGKVLVNKTIPYGLAHYKINVSKLMKGVYLVKVDNQSMHKFIKY